MVKKYNHVAVGGTFDLLHKGHETLLKKAFTVGQKVTIGVTTDSMNKKVANPTYQNQAERIKNVRDFLSKNKLAKRAKIIAISNIYGPTLKDKTIVTLVVSKDRVKNANQINIERKRKKLPKLPLIVIPIVIAQDKKPISSARIAKGEINRQGRVYENLILKITEKRFSENIRQKLKKPFGKITAIVKKQNVQIISVGDATTSKLLQNKIVPKLSVVDFKIQRKSRYQNLLQLGFAHANPDIIVKNDPGKISKSLALAIKNAMSSKLNGQVIMVDGEDDLAVIPAILLSRLGTIVYYGQPNRGLVKVEVTEDAKERLLSLLNLS